VSAPAPNASRRLRAEHLGSTLPPLMVAAERVAATVAQGVHGRRRVGPGETFWQYRQYSQGDTPNSIDWRQSAKSDRVFVREREWEAAQTVWLWCDRSPSMNYASQKNLDSKLERATLLTLATAALLVRGGEYISLLGTSLTPSTGRAALLRLTSELETSQSDSIPPESDIPRYADIFWVSDFLNPLSEIEARARGLAAAGVRGTLVQILDPAEANLPFQGHVRFEGLEGEAEHSVGKANSLVVPYARRLQARQAALTELAGRLGWTFLVHQTDHSAQSALLTIYQALAERTGTNA
jgi:uncharacterized protein (DUF58 family)